MIRDIAPHTCPDHVLPLPFAFSSLLPVPSKAVVNNKSSSSADKGLIAEVTDRGEIHFKIG